MPWHAHETGPIDWWGTWYPYYPPEDPPPRLQELRFDQSESDRYLKALLYEMYLVAQREFLELGWEGDGLWHYAGIPGHTSGPEAILAVKQQNNGTVYVLSPQPLVWLDS